MESLDGAAFDVVLSGTSLAQSILAAALAKAGKKVLHCDEQRYYGGEDASLSLDELVEAARSNKLRQAVLEKAETGLMASRQYCISLAPSIIPAVSPFITSLVNSGVAQYTGFRLLDSTALWDGQAWKRVPSSKADVFRDHSLSLPDKRRLMKALLFAASEFEDSEELKVPFLRFLKEIFGLSDHLASSLCYAVALCEDPSGDVLPRLRTYLRSSGRYGSSPFLIGQYGGAGELAQGFCRLSAVNGGIYILGEEIALIEQQDGRQRVTLGGQQRQTVTAEHVITLPRDVPTKAIARGIIILAELPDALKSIAAAPTDGDEPKEFDGALFVLPPTDGKAAFALLVGEGTAACPARQHVLYLSIESTQEPRQALHPLLKTLGLVDAPQLLSLFYRDDRHVTCASSDTVFYCASACDPLPAQACDDALRAAEVTFRRIVGDSPIEMFPTTSVASDD